MAIQFSAVPQSTFQEYTDKELLEMLRFLMKEAGGRQTCCTTPRINFNDLALIKNKNSLYFSSTCGQCKKEVHIGNLFFFLYNTYSDQLMDLADRIANFDYYKQEYLSSKKIVSLDQFLVSVH